MPHANALLAPRGRLELARCVVVTEREARSRSVIAPLRGDWLAGEAAPGTMGTVDQENRERYCHGTRSDLQPGDLIEPGYRSNYGTQRKSNQVYLTATLDAAIWGAELAVGEGPGRIYTVEPSGPIMDDPNLTDKKFPGNPTKSLPLS